MKKLFIPFILLITLITASCSVDKDYDLRSKNINYQINAGKQILVPIGSFPTIRVGDLLSKDAKEYFSKNEEGEWVFDPQSKVLKNFELGHYELHGLSFVSLSDFGVPEMRFYVTLKNTLPFAFELSSKIVDNNGNNIEGITSIIEATLPAGTADEAGRVDAVINISNNMTQEGIGFDGFNIILTVKEMPSTTVKVNHNLGISLKDVRLQLPEGINFRIKKKTSSDDSE